MIVCFIKNKTRIVILDPSFIKTKFVLSKQCFIKPKCVVQRMIDCFVEQESLFLVNTNELKDKNTFYELFIKPKANMLLDEKKKNKYRLLLVCFHKTLERWFEKVFY